jgi:hypothetical protein
MIVPHYQAKKKVISVLDPTEKAIILNPWGKRCAKALSLCL